MNMIFIKQTINEIKVLQKISDTAIKNVFADHAKSFKVEEIKFEAEFKKLIKNIVDKQVNEEQIASFLNKKYKDGRVSDYILIERNGETGEYQIVTKKYDDILDLNRGLSTLDKIEYQLHLATTTPIISIITLYENFIRELIAIECLEEDNELINDETIKFSDLKNLKFNSEDIKNRIVDEYCNTKLYGDKKRIEEIIKMLEIDCKDCETIVDDFREIYFRRNMYVHGIRKITDDYLKLPGRIKDKWIDKNNELKNVPEYYNHAFKTIKKIILMILIKKCVFKDKNKQSLGIIEDLIFREFYSQKEYEVACFAYRQLKKVEWIDDVQRYFFFVNYMVCLKYLKDKEFEKELNKWKTDTASPIFKMAKKLVQNDYVNINDLISQIIKTDVEYAKLNPEESRLYLIKEFINTWPLFLDYRKTDYYNDLLVKV